MPCLWGQSPRAQGIRFYSVIELWVGKVPIMTSFSKYQNKKWRWTEQSRGREPVHVHQSFLHPHSLLLLLCLFPKCWSSSRLGLRPSSPHILSLGHITLSHGFNYILSTPTHSAQTLLPLAGPNAYLTKPPRYFQGICLKLNSACSCSSPTQACSFARFPIASVNPHHHPSYIGRISGSQLSPG